MPTFIDNKVTNNDEHETVEPIMVTVALAEYRSLIDDIARKEAYIEYLQDRITDLENKLYHGVNNDDR